MHGDEYIFLWHSFGDLYQYLYMKRFSHINIQEHHLLFASAHFNVTQFQVTTLISLDKHKQHANGYRDLLHQVCFKNTTGYFIWLSIVLRIRIGAPPVHNSIHFSIEAGSRLSAIFFPQYKHCVVWGQVPVLNICQYLLTYFINNSIFNNSYFCIIGMTFSKQ